MSRWSNEHDDSLLVLQSRADGMHLYDQVAKDRKSRYHSDYRLSVMTTKSYVEDDVKTESDE